jgi:hypothetical protein
MSVSKPKVGELFDVNGNGHKGPHRYIGQTSSGLFVLEDQEGSTLVTPVADAFGQAVTEHVPTSVPLHAGHMYGCAGGTGREWVARVHAVFTDLDNANWVAYTVVNGGSHLKIMRELGFRRAYPDDLARFEKSE